SYQTDGMVIKLDSFAQRERLGATSKAPRWVIAYKYAAEQAQTTIRAVDWQVGKGGTLTPVARLDPVFLGGTTISNAALHNIDQMDIEIVGDALIDQIVDAGMVKTFADLYRLKKEQVMALERMADKSAQNVIDAIEQSRNRGLDRLLAGIGIRHVGNRVAHVLAQHFGSMDAIANASAEELSAVHEIGEAIADSVHTFFHNPAGRH